MKVTKKELNNKFIELCELMDYAYTKEMAINQSKALYYDLDHNSVCGGYKLRCVSVNYGGYAGAFGFSSMEERVNANTMYLVIQSLINGIELGINLKQTKSIGYNI